MNTRLVNTVADAIHRSQENGKRTPTGIAVDLESRQLLQSPETAAELERLRAQVAEYKRLALPWAHTMPDADLGGFLDDLVSAALDRWRTGPDGEAYPDRGTLAAIEAACANWRTPGQGYRSDEPETPAEVDTLAAWLYQRFTPNGRPWEKVREDDRAYWEHEAAAVRRAVARGGFKNPAQAAEEPTGQADAEVFVPRTERAYWVAIADALNAAESVGMAVGIDLDGTLTDHRMWSVVWDRDAKRWAVAGYEDDDDASGGGS